MIEGIHPFICLRTGATILINYKHLAGNSNNNDEYSIAATPCLFISFRDSEAIVYIDTSDQLSQRLESKTT